MHHYRCEDAVAEAYAMVFLVDSGLAQQTDVAQAFDRSVRTVHRHQGRYAQGGMAALGREEGWRRGRRRIPGKHRRSVEVLKNQGLSSRAVAHRLGVSEKAIRKLVGPLKPAARTQLAFTGMMSAATGAPAAPSTEAEAGRTPPAADHAVDGASISAPAHDDEPVAMSHGGEVVSPWHLFAVAMVAAAERADRGGCSQLAAAV